MGMLNKRDIRRCPYCKCKNAINSFKCYNCDLEFSQLGFLSNKEAKKAIKEKEPFESLEGEIILVKEFPEDLSRKRAFFWLLCPLFFGFFGAHCYYVGRYKRAIVMTACSSVYIVVVAICIALGWPNTVTFTIDTIILLGTFVFMVPFYLFFKDLLDMLFQKFAVPVKLKKPVDVDRMEGLL